MNSPRVYYEGLVAQVSGLLPQGPRLAVIGSTSFWHPQSEATCIAVEGGPGTAHEAAVAMSRDATLISVGKSGGHAAEVYPRVSRPAAVPSQSWLRLGQPDATPQQIADAIHDCVCACLDLGIR